MPEMDAPRALVFRPLVKGNEALGTRLESCVIWKSRAPSWAIILLFLVAEVKLYMYLVFYDDNF